MGRDVSPFLFVHAMCLMKRLANQGGQANYRINIPHAFAKNSNAPKASVSINRERRMNNERA